MRQAKSADGPARPHPQPTSTLARLIQRRLLIGLFVGFLITSTSLIVGYLTYYEVARAFNEASSEAGTARGLAVNLNDAVVAEVLHTRSYIIAGDEESLTLRDLAAQDFERTYAELQTRLTEMQSGLVRMPETTTVMLEELGKLQNEYDALADEIIPLLSSGNTEAAISLFDERSDSVVLRLLATKRNLRAEINAWEDRAEGEYFLRTSQIVLVTASVFLFGVFISGLFMMRLLAPLISALNYFELALIETSQNNTSHPTPLPLSLPEPNSPVFRAYNALVSRLRDSEASQLDFLAKVVHSLRSPLAAITGYAELMSNPTLRPVEANLEDYARVITREAKRLGQMIEQIVTAARIDDQQMELTLSPVWLNPLIAEVVAEAKQRSRREITFADYQPSTIVACDPLYIRQALLNLIDNAVKFSPQATPIQVTLRPSASPSKAEIAVADQGIGISETDRPLLFTRFGRVYNEHTRNISGSGLGLYIAKHIIERHFGEITVQSQIGHGSTFIVTLPSGNGAI